MTSCRIVNEVELWRYIRNGWRRVYAKEEGQLRRVFAFHFNDPERPFMVVREK